MPFLVTYYPTDTPEQVPLRAALAPRQSDYSARIGCNKRNARCVLIHLQPTILGGILHDMFATDLHVWGDVLS